jgi:surface polysaccharide O-acyltransferase-like enzyme
MQAQETISLIQRGESSNVNNRNIYADLLRIIATFGVIIIHVSAIRWYITPINSYNWQILNVYHSIIRWPVPIFVMISGIFNLRPMNAGVEFRYEIKKTFKKIYRLIFAIVFWAILYNPRSILKCNT